jgi:hypothetical protein
MIAELPLQWYFEYESRVREVVVGCAVLLLNHTSSLHFQVRCLYSEELLDKTSKFCTLYFVPNVLKGTQDWEFFWLRFWNLYYFFVSYVNIFLQKIFFDWAIIGGVAIFPRSHKTTKNEKNFWGRSNFFSFHLWPLYMSQC